MDSFLMVLQTLTVEERDSIPPGVRLKIQMALDNQINLYQATINGLYKKIKDSESSLDNLQTKVEDCEKKIKHVENEKHGLFYENNLQKTKIESLKNEIKFLTQIIKNKNKENTNTVREDYENKKKEFEKLLSVTLNNDKDCSVKIKKLEQNNKLLLSKMGDLKKQLSYLLDSSTGSKSVSEEVNEQKHNLIKIIQTLSKENDRLNGLKCEEMDIEHYKTSLVVEKDRIIKDLNMALERHSKNNENKTNGDYQSLFNEYQRVALEKNNLYEQICLFYTNKVSLEEKLKAMESEINKKDTEIILLKNKQENFEKINDKYNEVNTELVKSNTLIREYKQRIYEISKKLEESEQRYSKYILSNRSDIVAILGREVEYLKDKVSRFIQDFMEIISFYSLFREEEEKLLSLYRDKYSQIENHLIEQTKYERLQTILQEIMTTIPNEMSEAIDSLCTTLGGVFEDVHTLFNTTENISSHSNNLIYQIKNDNTNKDFIIKSLINGNTQIYESLVKEENKILKNEIILLNARIENLQSEDYSEVINKLDQIKTENDNLREYITNLSSEVLNKEHTIRNLEDNCKELTENLSNKKTIIEKYEKVVEKLRKIKNEYVKLKTQIKEEKNTTVSNEQNLYLNTPPKEDRSMSQQSPVENPVRPLLSTEDFTKTESFQNKRENLEKRS